MTVEAGANVAPAPIAAAAAPLTLAFDAVAPSPIPGGFLGTIVDVQELPGFESLTWADLSGWYTATSSFEQDSPPDLTGSASLHANGHIIRPANDADVGEVWVVEVLFDYLQPNNPAQILSKTTIQPGQKVDAIKRIVEVFEWPEGIGSGKPRITVVEQKTDFYIARFSTVVQDFTPPTPPTITTTGRTTTTVDLVVSGGTDDIGIVAYKIFRDGGLITIVGVDGAYTDTGLGVESTHTYTARAVDLAGNESLNSSPDLLVTTFAETDPGLDYGCDATNSCPDPNLETEKAWERVTGWLGRLSFTLTAVNPRLGYLFDEVVGRFVGAVSSLYDIVQLASAIRRGDSADIKDETEDLLSDLAGLLGLGFLPGV